MAEKIEALIRSWDNEAGHIDVQSTSANNELSDVSSSVDVTTSPAAPKNTDNVAAQLQDMLTRTFDLALILMLVGIPEAKKSALDLLQKLRSTISEQVLTESEYALKDIFLK